MPTRIHYLVHGILLLGVMGIYQAWNQDAANLKLQVQELKSQSDSKDVRLRNYEQLEQSIGIFGQRVAAMSETLSEAKSAVSGFDEFDPEIQLSPSVDEQGRSDIERWADQKKLAQDSLQKLEQARDSLATQFGSVSTGVAVAAALRVASIPSPTPTPLMATKPKQQEEEAPADASAVCRDGTYSYSRHRSGTCSHHGGVARWLAGAP